MMTLFTENLKDKYGYSHVADASLFFDNFNGD